MINDKTIKLLFCIIEAYVVSSKPPPIDFCFVLQTLMSHSMGARLAFSCLLELCRCGARGLVQDVVLLGATVTAQTPERWKMARRAVAGRMVNCYSTNDWLLSVMFWQAAGLAPVEVEGVENVSLSSLVNGHFEYVQRIDEIMECLQVALH